MNVETIKQIISDYQDYLAEVKQSQEDIFNGTAQKATMGGFMEFMNAKYSNE